MWCPLCRSQLVVGPSCRYETLVEHVGNPNEERWERATVICPNQNCEANKNGVFWAGDGEGPYNTRFSQDYAWEESCKTLDQSVPPDNLQEGADRSSEIKEFPLQSYPNIDKALRDGCRVRGFRSGGGLRVIRVEDAAGQLKGYGEHPNVLEALTHADEDYAAGKRPYEEVYGKLYLHYLTGTTEVDSMLDGVLLRGGKFVAVSTQNREGIVVGLRDYKRLKGRFLTTVIAGRGATFVAALQDAEERGVWVVVEENGLSVVEGDELL